MTDILPPDTSNPLPRISSDRIALLADKWPWFATLGVLLLILGAIALGLVVSATIASVFAIGIFMIAAGLLEIAIGFQARDWGRLALWVATGLLYAVAGGVTLARPGMAAAVFTLMLGAGLMATGVVRLFLGSHLPSGAPRGLAIASGVVTTLFGLIIVLGWPGDSLIVLGTILGVDLLFAGLNWLTLGLALRSQRQA